jgi:hypothetical protein
MVELKCNGNKIWLDLDELYPPNYKHPNTVFKSTAIALQAMGEDVSYEFLMGISGAAFRVQLHEEWCPNSPHPDCGFDCTAVAMETTRLGVISYSCKKKDNKQPEQIIESIVEHINNGQPVLMGSEETGLVVGYVNDEAGKKLLIREPYSNKGDKPEVLKGWPWAFAVITKGPRKMDKGDSVDSLKRAIELAHTQKVGKYVCGFAAYERWISDLLNDSKMKKLKGHNEPEISNANAHIYYCLIDARECAAKYIGMIEDQLSEQALPYLRQASKYYENLAEQLNTGWKNILWAWQFEKGNKWTPEMRKGQATLLEKALELERVAISEIEKAISLFE